MSPMIEAYQVEHLLSAPNLHPQITYNQPIHTNDVLKPQSKTKTKQVSQAHSRLRLRLRNVKTRQCNSDPYLSIQSIRSINPTNSPPAKLSNESSIPYPIILRPSSAYTLSPPPGQCTSTTRSQPHPQQTNPLIPKPAKNLLKTN